MLFGGYAADQGFCENEVGSGGGGNIYLTSDIDNKMAAKALNGSFLCELFFLCWSVKSQGSLVFSVSVNNHCNTCR